MIHRIYSSDPKFKTVSFHSGFNLLLVDVAPGSSDKETRNRAGKSSLVEIVHFLLGADCDKHSIFRYPDIVEHTFGLEFDLRAQRVRVERSGRQASRIYLPGVDTATWPIRPKKVRDDIPSLSVADWNKVLGHLMFGLSLRDDVEGEKFGPFFRGLFSYFARRVSVGGFDEPHKFWSEQRLWEQQVLIAFLLGLDWTIPRSMEVIRAKERTIRQLKDHLKETGGMRWLLSSSSELGTQITLAQSKISSLKQDLAGFKVLQQYHDLEAEADVATARLAGLADDNHFDQQLVDQLQQALVSEAPPDSADLERMYREAGVALPTVALRRFDEVKAFHESVLRNRRLYIQGELTEAKKRIGDRREQAARLDERRSALMATLRSAGALEQYTGLQEELGRIVAHAQALQEQHQLVRQIENTKLELEMERARLELRLSQDHSEQHEQIDEAVLGFHRISEQLYSEPGELVVSNKLTGAPLSVQIYGIRSEGIARMQVFCFDLTLMLLCLGRHIGPQFLIHDSHLFDGVDPRQTQKALELALADSAARDYQYVVSLNSDTLDLLGTGVDFRKYAIDPRLSDQEGGGLFGRRIG